MIDLDDSAVQLIIHAWRAISIGPSLASAAVFGFAVRHGNRQRASRSVSSAILAAAAVAALHWAEAIETVFEAACDTVREVMPSVAGPDSPIGHFAPPVVVGMVAALACLVVSTAVGAAVAHLTVGPPRWRA